MFGNKYNKNYNRNKYQNHKTTVDNIKSYFPKMDLKIIQETLINNNYNKHKTIKDLNKKKKKNYYIKKENLSSVNEKDIKEETKNSQISKNTLQEDICQILFSVDKSQSKDQINIKEEFQEIKNIINDISNLINETNISLTNDNSNDNRNNDMIYFVPMNYYKQNS